MYLYQISADTCLEGQVRATGHSGPDLLAIKRILLCPAQKKRINYHPFDAKMHIATKRKRL